MIENETLRAPKLFNSVN